MRWGGGERGGWTWKGHQGGPTFSSQTCDMVCCQLLWDSSENPWLLLTLSDAQKLPVSAYIGPGTAAVSTKWSHSYHRDFIKNHQCQQCCQHPSDGVLLIWALQSCHNCFSIALYLLLFSLLVCFMQSLNCKWLCKAMGKQTSSGRMNSFKT